MLRQSVLVLTAGVFLSIGCGTSASSSEAIGATSSAVVDGTFDSSNTYSAIGAVNAGSLDFNDRTCSGTLVSTRFVLSAAHCFVPDSTSRLNDPAHGISRFSPPCDNPYTAPPKCFALGSDTRAQSSVINFSWDICLPNQATRLSLPTRRRRTTLSRLCLTSSPVPTKVPRLPTSH